MGLFCPDQEEAMAVSAGNAIELRVDNIAQLFDTLDPYPFPERDLNRDAEEYIVGWAGELSPKQPLRIIVHHPDTGQQRIAFSALRKAIVGYFEARSIATQRELNELFRIGRLSLLIGLATLVTCLFLAQLAAELLQEAPVRKLIEESFLILGWVANWRPLDIFLYDWWPLVRRRQLYRRIAAARIDEMPYEIRNSSPPVAQA
jgi:hypothetical protein